MMNFAIAMTVFLALHAIPSIPGLLPRLVAAFGRRIYLIAYSLASIATLSWVFVAALGLDYVELWPSSVWQAWMSLVLSPIALFLLLAGLISPNAVSVGFRTQTRHLSAITAITRHPVLWGFAIWAGGHIPPNGDLRSVLLFGILLLFALAGIVASEHRARRRLGSEWPEIEAATSIVPFAAVLQGRARLRADLPLLVGGLAAVAVTAALLAGAHAALFGADPLLAAGL